MYLCKEYSDPSEIQEEWNFLYSGSHLSYCQSFFWQKEIFHFHQMRLFFARKKLLYRYFLVLADNIPVLIAPLELFLKKRSASIIGEYAPNDYYDFIVKDQNSPCYQGALSALFSYLKLSYRISTLTIKDSHIHLSLCPAYQFTEGESTCVLLNRTWKNVDEWFATLSKSARQNMRTSFNRSKTDGYEISFKKYDGPVSSKLARELFNFHEKRLIGRYHQSDNVFGSRLLFRFLHFWSNILRPWRVKDKMLERVVQSHDIDFRLYTLMLNKRLAAYYLGFLSEDKKTISFFRVCIDDDFGRYSPGMMLFKYILEDSQSSFDVFDFSIGNEKYKYVLGCHDVALSNYVVRF
jgi:hypothetical protein